MIQAVTEQYRDIGVEEYYKTFSATYENPHTPFVIQCLQATFNPEWKNVLDLACGNGLVSKWVKLNHPDTRVVGCDKFMAERYRHETHNECYEFTFEDIASGFRIINNHYDAVICSYAIDLLDHSYLASLAWQLASISDNLILIRPNNHVLDVKGCWKLEKQVKFSKSRATLFKHFH